MRIAEKKFEFNKFMGPKFLRAKSALLPLDIRLHSNPITTLQNASMYAQQQLAYAPTPYSYTPSHSLTATVNLDEEVKLAESSAERDLYESLAEIYSIIITLDALEKAYLRDSIQENEYTDTCDRLLRQYKSCLADESVAAAFGDLEHFKAEWDVCLAFSRPH